MKPFKIIGPPSEDIAGNPLLKKFETWINRFRYKPNTYFRWMRGPFTSLDYFDGVIREPSVFLDIVIIAPDVNGKEGTVEISHRSTITFNALMADDFSYFKFLVECSVKNAEMHEMDEFLTLDGEKIHDPHANDKNL